MLANPSVSANVKEYSIKGSCLMGLCVCIETFVSSDASITNARKLGTSEFYSKTCLRRCIEYRELPMQMLSKRLRKASLFDINNRNPLDTAYLNVANEQGTRAEMQESQLQSSNTKTDSILIIRASKRSGMLNLVLPDQGADTTKTIRL